jgi:hypothetical protein
MTQVEGLRKQNPGVWEQVTNGSGPYSAGLYINSDVTLVLRDRNDNDVSHTFIAGSFVPLDIKLVVSGIAGTEAIGYNK